MKRINNMILLKLRSLRPRIVWPMILGLLPLQALSEIHSKALVDIRLQETNANESWLNGGLGAFRGSRDSSHVQLGQAILFSQWSLSERLALRSQVSVYDDASDDAFGVGELYLKYKQPTSTPFSFEAKLGAFFPELSLENTQAGWTTHTPLSNSAINTWIGEELRMIGGELKIKRRIDLFGKPWRFGSSLGSFMNNDTAGAMLSWRGWAMHDRQMRLGERIRIANLPSIGSGTGFIKQSPYFEPFVEVDSRMGYITSLFAESAEGAKIRLHHYDNRGDPLALKEGQYAWHTQFIHLGVTWPITPSIQVLGQLVTGSSEMGSAADGQVNIDFDAWFIGLSKKYEPFTFSIRLDHFEVTDLDDMPNDDNNQKGDAWTIGARADVSGFLSLHLEYIETDEFNAARSTLTLDPNNRSRLLQLSAQWRL